MSAGTRDAPRLQRRFHRGLPVVMVSGLSVVHGQGESGRRGRSPVLAARLQQLFEFRVFQRLLAPQQVGHQRDLREVLDRLFMYA